VITNLTLSNFKCFLSQAIPLGNLTLLTGLNGMGKSSVIQALLLLRQTFLHGMLGRGLSLSGELAQIGTAADALCENAENESISFGIESSGSESLWTFDYPRAESNFLNLVSGPQVNDILGLFSDDFHYLQAERLGPRLAYPISDYVVRQHKQMGTKGEFALQYLAEFGKHVVPELRRHSSAVSDTLQDQVEAWAGEVSPGVRFKLDAHPGMDLIHAYIGFAGNKILSKDFRPTNSGFGIMYALPILIALLDTSVDGIVILENPEAHLHPRGQLKIGELMARAASTGTQVIVESHSDHVLNGVRLAVKDEIISPESIKIHYFSRAIEQSKANTIVSSPTIDADGRLDQWPDGFFDEMDKALERLLAP
jgi:predicted ATPase